MTVLASTEGPGLDAWSAAVYRCDVCLCRQTYHGLAPLGLPDGWRAVAPRGGPVRWHLCPVCLRRAESDLARERARRGTPA